MTATMCDVPPGIDPELVAEMAALDDAQRREMIAILYRSLPWWRRVRVKVWRRARGDRR